MSFFPTETHTRDSLFLLSLSQPLSDHSATTPRRACSAVLPQLTRTSVRCPSTRHLTPLQGAPSALSLQTW